jgi:hypothetical protein
VTSPGEKKAVIDQQLTTEIQSRNSEWILIRTTNYIHSGESKNPIRIHQKKSDGFTTGICDHTANVASMEAIECMTEIQTRVDSQTRDLILVDQMKRSKKNLDTDYVQPPEQPFAKVDAPKRWCLPS